MPDIIVYLNGEPFRGKDNGDGTYSLATNVTDSINRLVGRISNYDVLANGTLGALNETVELAGQGLGTVGIGISGEWAGTIVAEITTGDGVWDAIPLVDNTLGSAALSTTVNGNFLVGTAGSLTLRLRMSLYASGTATVYLEGTSAAAGVFLSRSIPTGINTIGSVNVPTINSVAPQFDDTDKLAVSKYGYGATAGDTPERIRVDCASADVHEPAANTPAVVTYAAVPGLKHVITGVAWSYSGGVPSGGNLKIEDVSGTTVFTADITDAGPGSLTFPVPKKSAAVNTAMIITLATGGSAITGKVSTLNHWTEA